MISKAKAKINWYGTYILTKREIMRFFRVYNQTLIAPVVSSMIFLAIFILAIRVKDRSIAGVEFINFISYGLVIMACLQNAFANSSSSFIMSKVLGYIHDILTPPLGGIEIVTAFTLGAIARGVVVGAITAFVLSFFIDYQLYHPLYMIIFTILGCIFVGLLGILSGMIADSFDKNAAITSYIITPLSFLSGTFYSVKSLPIFFQKFNLVNPFFYMIDGFRYCFTNYADGNLYVGFFYISIANIILFFILVRLIDIGWKIKS